MSLRIGASVVNIMLFLFMRHLPPYLKSTLFKVSGLPNYFSVLFVFIFAMRFMTFSMSNSFTAENIFPAPILFCLIPVVNQKSSIADSNVLLLFLLQSSFVPEISTKPYRLNSVYLSH